LQGSGQTLSASSHANFIPNHLAQFAMNAERTAIALDGKNFFDVFVHIVFAAFEIGVSSGYIARLSRSEIIRDSVGCDKITI
jgi:hypothetical protein